MSSQESAPIVPWPGWLSWDDIRKNFEIYAASPSISLAMRGMIELVDVLRNNPAIAHVQPAFLYLGLAVFKFQGQLQQPTMGWVTTGIYKMRQMTITPPEKLIDVLRADIAHLSEVDYALPADHPKIDAATQGEFRGHWGWDDVVSYYQGKVAEYHDPDGMAQMYLSVLPDVRRVADEWGWEPSLHTTLLTIWHPHLAQQIDFLSQVTDLIVRKETYISMDQAVTAILDYLSRVTY